MNNIINMIKDARHIVVVADYPNIDSLASASAFYTYLLQEHKKVSFFCEDKIEDTQLEFMPWIEKIRNSFSKSVDLLIIFNSFLEDNLYTGLRYDFVDSKSVFNFFKENDIKINKKMATALYAGILYNSEGFIGDKVDGTIFAIAKELIDSGADYRVCNDFIMRYISLATFRLKAIMYKNMELFSDAKVAFICVTQDDIKSSGASLRDCDIVLKEALYLKSVEVSIVLMENIDLSLECLFLSKGLFDIQKVVEEFDGFVNSKSAKFNLGSKYSIKEAKEKILQLIDKEI